MVQDGKYSTFPGYDASLFLEGVIGKVIRLLGLQLFNILKEKETIRASIIRKISYLT